MFRSYSRRPLWSVICAIAIVFTAWPARSVSAATLTATLVQTIQTSAWSPASPDPSGITYWPSRNTLLISDGEVDEMPNLFTGDNLFEATLGGSLVDSYSTIGYSTEPTGIEIAINPLNNHIFVSDDSKKKVFEINLGGDGRPNTGDDQITSISTAAFGNNDPEGIAYGAGKLFVTDGFGKEIFVVAPGSNGVFDGVAPTGDDVVTNFDTEVLIQPDPEGVEYNPATNTLYIISNDEISGIVETTVSGSLVNTIDISALNLVSPGDLALAPGSQNAAVKNIYIVDRGVDNNDDPNENDGRIYEISVASTTPITGNKLANPGFELDSNNDGKPDTWSNDTDFTRSAALAHSGSYAGRFFSTANTGATIKQTMNSIAPGTTYRFSGWVNIPVVSDTFDFKLRVKWRDSAGSAIRTDTIQVFTAHTSGNWIEVTRTLNSPAGTAKADMMMVVSSLNATIYADDFVFGQ